MAKPRGKVTPAFIASQFKPGQSGNPGGQSKLVSAVRKLSKEEFASVIDLFLKADFQELKKINEDPTSTSLRRFIAQVILKGYDRADWQMLNSILDRLIGKPKESVEVTSLRRVVKKLDGTEVHYTTGDDEGT